MNEVMVQSQEGFSTRCQKVLQVARELFQGKPDWVTFFRETLGVSGAARNVFPRQQDYVAFEKSREYAEIQNMVLALRNRKIPGGTGNEPTRVITVRLPESLHEALKAEASDHNTSMNKLCISKLLQVLVDNAQANKMPTRTLPQPQPQMRPQLQPPVAVNQLPPPIKSQQPATQVPPNFRSTYNQQPPQTGMPPQSNIPPRNFGQ
ncbi:MAG: toxin-antitoxin system HicB family antitoxin [Planctomycetota bacterium]